MSEQPPNDPPNNPPNNTGASGSGEPPERPADSPYGNPPPPPATNPYAPPPASPTPPPAPAQPQVPPPAAPPPAGYGYQPPPPPPGYQAPTYAAPGYPPGNPSPGHGGLAITALVISIVGLTLCWIPILGIVLTLAGLILGIVAWAAAGKSNRPKGMGIAATIMSALGLLVAIAATVFVFWIYDKVQPCIDADLTQAQEEQCIEDAVTGETGV